MAEDGSADMMRDWQPVSPDELVVGDVLRHGTLDAHVLSWVWRPHRDEFVIAARYSEAAPGIYRGAATQIVCPANSTLLAWRTETPHDQCTTDA